MSSRGVGPLKLVVNYYILHQKNKIIKEYSCQNTLWKMKKVQGVTPDYEKMQADSSH